MNLNSRSNMARTPPVFVLTRPRAVAEIALGCLSESYNGASDNVPGYDLDWDWVSAPFHDSAYDYGDGSSYNDIGNLSTSAEGLSVFSNELAATRISGGWGTGSAARSHNLERTQSEAATDDVTGHLTIANIPTSPAAQRATWGLGVRMEDDEMHLVYGISGGSGYPMGYYLILNKDGDGARSATLEIWMSPGFGVDIATPFFLDTLASPTLADFSAGSEITLTVTGTPGSGGDLHVLATLDGGTLFDHDATSMEALWGDATIWDETFPAGRRGGVVLNAQSASGNNFTAIDGLVRADDFELCPAAP